CIRCGLSTCTAVHCGLCGASFLSLEYNFRHRKPDSFLGRVLKSLFYSICRLARTPKLAAPGLALSFLVHCGMNAALALNLQSTSDTALPWGQLLWTFPVISILAAAPVTF